MGINEFFYGGDMRLGCCSGVKRLILLSFTVLSCFSLATEVISENKAERIVRDLLSSAYNRTHNLPAVIPNGQLSTMQQVHKANVLRSIAKKAVRVSGVLYKKHPITGLAVTLGAGFLADELIDSAFQKFTSALKDQSGQFYVMVTNPNTGEQTKVYLEEEPSILNPAYISLGKRKIVTYSSDLGGCDSSSFDTSLNCIAERELEKKLSYLDSLSGQTVSEGKIISYSSHPLYEDGRYINYSYKRCFTNSDECRTESGFFTVRVVKNETDANGLLYIVPHRNVVDENQIVLRDDTQIANFAKKAISLDSQDFTSEERLVISNINSQDVRQYFSDPRLKAKDLANFRYSESMFDNPLSSNGSSNSDIGNNSGGNNTNDKPFALVDFSAPDVPLPDLEAPSSNTILSPLKKFLPDLQNFELRSHAAQCPIWTIDIEFLNFHSEINEHCVLVEKYRELLKLVFGIIWSFIALRYVLSA